MKMNVEDVVAVIGLLGLAIWMFLALPILYGASLQYDFWFSVSTAAVVILVTLVVGAALGRWKLRIPHSLKRQRQYFLRSDRRQRLKLTDPGLRRPSADLIVSAQSDSAAQVIGVGSTLLATAMFCALSLLSPDSALLGEGEKISVPFAGPVSFLGFMLLAPIVLIVLRIYLEICVEHNKRLNRIGRFSLAVLKGAPAGRSPTLLPLRNRLIRVFNDSILLALLPTTMVLFAWKAAVLPYLEAGLFIATVAIVAYHVMLAVFDCPRRQRVEISVLSAIVVGMAISWAGPPQRKFDLAHESLAGRSLPGEKLLRGVTLSRIDLSNSNLSDADLRDTDLSKAKASNADLSCTKLHCSNLSHAKLIGAKLDHADLSKGSLDKADLHDADISSANLSDADLSDANLNNANLRNASLNRADLRNADMVDADLSGADLRGAKLSDPTQLDKTCGDKRTRWPENVNKRPQCAPESTASP